MMIAHQEYWDDVPPLGRAGRRWLRRRLYATTQSWLRTQTKVDPEDPEAAPLIYALVCDLAAEPSSLLTWEDAEHFSGRAFSSGHYVFKKDAVLRRLPKLFAATAQKRAAPPSPIPPGPIDVHAALAALAAPAARVIAEPRAYDLLSVPGVRWSEASNRLFRAQTRIQAKRPKVCHCCGVTFTLRRSYAATCPVCKAAGRKRCLGCNRVFKPRHGRVRRCNACLRVQQQK